MTFALLKAVLIGGPFDDERIHVLCNGPELPTRIGVRRQASGGLLVRNLSYDFTDGDEDEYRLRQGSQYAHFGGRMLP